MRDAKRKAGIRWYGHLAGEAISPWKLGMLYFRELNRELGLLHIAEKGGRVITYR